MHTARTIGSLQGVVEQWRWRGERIAFVPTMGNLHAGHLALVCQAGELADRVVASIFVNPMQFGPQEDFQTYPRTPQQDSAALAEQGVDVLFMPEADEIYPRGLAASTRVEVPELSDILCGAARPGHFSGVATVVAKLLNIVRPDIALFGKKDFQQLLVVRRMVADLCMGVDVVGVPTVREADGLAISSRNHYLSAAERTRAPALYESLNQARARLQAGDSDITGSEAETWERLESAGFQPEYVSIRRAEDLGLAVPGSPLVVLAAGWLGQARLIDNVEIGIWMPGRTLGYNERA